MIWFRRNWGYVVMALCFMLSGAVLTTPLVRPAHAQLAQSSGEQSLASIARSLERLASRPQQVQQPCRCECAR